MLRTTEQLTWSAPLDKVRRGCEVLKPKKDTGTPSAIAWQLFSGEHVRCKVISTQPSESPWTVPPNGIPLFASESCIDRQLRVVVECGPIELGNAANQSQRDLGSSSGAFCPTPSSSQTKAPLVPVDIDLVRISKVYERTSRSMDAVQAYYQDKHVLIRYLDEYDASKAHRLQLTFKEEKEQQYFLGLIEPDCRIRSADVELKPPKTEGGMQKNEKKVPLRNDSEDQSKVTTVAPGDGSSAVEDSQNDSQSQSLIDKILQLTEAKLRQSLSQSAGCCNHAVQSYSTQSLNDRRPPLGCSSCTSSLKREQGSNELDHGHLPSSFSAAPMETPPTLLSEEHTLESDEEVDEDEAEREWQDEALFGWPDPSAVDCIRDDVDRLCLSNPNLDWMIARCVDEHLRTSARHRYVEDE